MGEDAFWAVESNRETYSEPDVPLVYMFVFQTFLEIYNASGESVTWSDIFCYNEIRETRLTQFEITMILKCIGWANSEVSELRSAEGQT